MKKVDILVGFILLALGLKGSNMHICACYSLTRWVQSVAKSGMARQWDAVKKKQMPCIPLTIMFLFPKKHFGSKTALLSDIGAPRARASGPLRASTQNARQA